MAVTLRAVGSSSAGATSSTPGLPSGTAADDILICVAAWASNLTVTWPAGWTQILKSDMSATRHFEVRWKRAAGGESDPTITLSGTDVLFAQIAGYTGCTTSGSPVDQTSTANVASSATVTFNTITPTQANTEVCFAAGVGSTGSPVTVSGSNPAPTTQFSSSTAVGNDAAVFLASGLKTDTTATGSRTATKAGVQIYGSVTFNLLPAATAAAVGKDLAVPWTVRQAVAKTGELPWAVRSATAKDLAAPYGVRSLASGDSELSWVIRAAVADDLEIPWGMAGAVGADARLDWTVCQAVAGELEVDWVLFGGVAADLDLAWVVLSGPILAVGLIEVAGSASSLSETESGGSALIEATGGATSSYEVT